MSKTQYTPPLRQFNPKDGISALFTPVPQTFDDLRREWRSYVEQEAAADSVAMKEHFARRRTAILEQFPQWERPAIIDRLNAPVEDAAEVAHAI